LEQKKLSMKWQPLNYIKRFTWVGLTAFIC